MQALLFPAFDYIAKNRWAQIVVGVGFFFAILKIRDKWRDRRTTKRVERRIEKKSRKVQARIEERNDEKLEKTRATRANPPTGISNVAELSDEQRRRLIRD